MQIDLDDLRQYYASLPDEGLIEIDRADLSEAARRCYDEEVARRGLIFEHEVESFAPNDGVERRFDGGDGEGADWLEDAACVCTYMKSPGGSAESDAEFAREILKTVGIPSQISVNEVDATKVEPHVEYGVMVPGALNLWATSVLDKEIFNDKAEAHWQAHFEMLSDDDLRGLDSETICAGMVDRIERLKRAHQKEMDRRGLR